MFSEHFLRKGLKTRVFGNKIFTFDSIDSTNNCAKAVAGCGATEGTVVIAEQQTAGRGRMGRPWQSNPNENLIFSIVLRPRLSADALNLLPLYVAVAISAAIEHVTGLKVECKWPNDILYNGKKVAGILIEGSIKQDTMDYVVIGVGINVNQMRFEGELSTRASSLKLESNKEVDRVRLFKEILAGLEKDYKLFQTSGFKSVVPQWMARSTMLNKTISISQQGNIISGVVKGLSPEGGLVLKSNDAEQTVFAGDVTVLQM